MTNDFDRENTERMKDDLDEILRRVDSLPILDSRSPDEILGYDEYGIPS
jgi:hypothetical protein